MKKVAILTLATLFAITISTGAFATGKKPPKEKEHRNNTAIAIGAASAKQSQEQSVEIKTGPTTAEGGSAYTGDNNNIINDNTEYTSFGFVTTPENSVKVGEVRRSIQSLTVSAVAANKDNFGFGLSWNMPLTWGRGKAVDEALEVEARRLKLREQELQERMLQQRVIFAAQTAKMCTDIHTTLLRAQNSQGPEEEVQKQVEIIRASYSELWDTCAQTEHFNDRKTNDLIGRHNGEEFSNQRRFSPHHHGYEM